MLNELDYWFGEKVTFFTLTPKETTPNRIYDGERRPKKIWKLFLFSNAKQAKFQTEENKIKWQRSWLQELLWMKEAVVDPCFVVVVVFISFICGVHTRVFVPHCQRGHKLKKLGICTERSSQIHQYLYNVYNSQLFTYWSNVCVLK